MKCPFHKVFGRNWPYLRLRGTKHAPIPQQNKVNIIIVWASPSTGHAGGRNGERRVENKNVIVAYEVPGNASRGSEEASRPIIHEAHLNRFGVMLKD